MLAMGGQLALTGMDTYVESKNTSSRVAPGPKSGPDKSPGMSAGQKEAKRRRGGAKSNAELP